MQPDARRHRRATKPSDYMYMGMAAGVLLSPRKQPAPHSNTHCCCCYEDTVSTIATCPPHGKGPSCYQLQTAKTPSSKKFAGTTTGSCQCQPTTQPLKCHTGAHPGKLFCCFVALVRACKSNLTTMQCVRARRSSCPARSGNRTSSPFLCNCDSTETSSNHTTALTDKAPNETR